MKKALIVAGIAVLALSGCAPMTFTMSEPVTISTDDGYVASVRTDAPSLKETEASVLIGSGKGVCSQLVANRTGDDLFDKAVKAGLTPAEGAAIISSAIDAYCPEQSWVSTP